MDNCLLSVHGVVLATEVGDLLNKSSTKYTYPQNNIGQNALLTSFASVFEQILAPADLQFSEKLPTFAANSTPNPYSR
jgi:hypothetical protein